MEADKLSPFLRKTWSIIEDPETDHMVTWSSTGKSFIVVDVEAFSKEVLPRFFKHSNWSSFVRQLNTYGFRKIDPDRWEFANDHFVRGNKDMLHMIQRRKVTTAGPATESAVPVPPPSSSANVTPQSYNQQRVPTMPMFQAQSGFESFNPLFAVGAAPGAQPRPLVLPPPQVPRAQEWPQNPPVAPAFQANKSFHNVASPSAAAPPAALSNQQRQQQQQLYQQRQSPDSSIPSMEYVLTAGQSGSGAHAVPSSSAQQDSLSNKTLSSGTGGGPSLSTTENEADYDEAHKSTKRNRGDMNAVAASGASSGPSGSDSGLPGLASTSMDRDGQPLPPGIIRPIAQPLANPTQNLIASMAGQLGRLTALANEVQGLKEDNVALRHGMDSMYNRQNVPAPGVAPIHAMLAAQRDTLWQYKLMNDGVELKIAAQQRAQETQMQHSAALEAQLAQQYKFSFDTAEMTRLLEARNKQLTSQLYNQEDINLRQLQANAALEARVKELEDQLSGQLQKAKLGGQEMMIKSLEDRVRKSLTQLMSNQLSHPASSQSNSQEAVSDNSHGPGNSSGNGRAGAHAEAVAAEVVTKLAMQ